MGRRLNRKKFKLRLFDSANGRTVKTDLAMDVTGDCPVHARKKERGTVVLLFGKAERGRIVQIVRGGMVIHFFVEELRQEMRVAPIHDTFGSTAGELGLTKAELKKLIEKYAPAASGP